MFCKNFVYKLSHKSPRFGIQKHRNMVVFRGGGQQRGALPPLENDQVSMLYLGGGGNWKETGENLQKCYHFVFLPTCQVSSAWYPTRSCPCLCPFHGHRSREYTASCPGHLATLNAISYFAMWHHLGPILTWKESSIAVLITVTIFFFTNIFFTFRWKTAPEGYMRPSSCQNSLSLFFL